MRGNGTDELSSKINRATAGSGRQLLEQIRYRSGSIQLVRDRQALEWDAELGDLGEVRPLPERKDGAPVLDPQGISLCRPVEPRTFTSIEPDDQALAPLQHDRLPKVRPSLVKTSVQLVELPTNSVR
jgi:hypothetical protein